MKKDKTSGARNKDGFRAQKILVPLDFSDPSRNALRYALTLAQQFGGKLVLFYALEPVATPDFAYHPLMMASKEAAAKARHQLAALCRDEGVDAKWVAETIVREGTAHVEIIEAAKKLGVDLIVIATHGNTGLKHVLLGSVAERVVRHAHCPVMVVRA
ncbi:MAG TPA: universal stress protein [Verrucomicrobiae bacterium]|jgi:nucleotide-binding universal stress UspA family protein